MLLDRLPKTQDQIPEPGSTRKNRQTGPDLALRVPGSGHPLLVPEGLVLLLLQVQVLQAAGKNRRGEAFPDEQPCGNTARGRGDGDVSAQCL